VCSGRKAKKTACLRSDIQCVSLVHVSASLLRIRIFHAWLDVHMVHHNLNNIDHFSSVVDTFALSIFWYDMRYNSSWNYNVTFKYHIISKILLC
jgi:hypothetical protein